ncbi:hypothetical protein QR680_012306 [Steinernema hermaphroditum]|uniref:MULE transposase domain-containing protein n=1 Tax=Steinernema hermaphroditum TaxID=289476 RepID=A0AA39I3K4_9BILA|nr:hypothetical protein QR680_012306 [Steinernema hermaphroditum]
MAFLDSTIAALTPYAKKDEKMGLFYANLSGLSNNAALLTKNEESEEYYERILADISPDYKEKRDSSLSTIHKKNNKKIARLRRFRAKEQGQLAFVNELENVFCSHLPLLRERRDSTIERIVEDWFSLQKEHLPDKQLPSTPMERNNTAFKAFLLQQQENQALEEEVKTFEEILNGKLQALRCPSCDILEARANRSELDIVLEEAFREEASFEESERWLEKAKKIDAKLDEVAKKREARKPRKDKKDVNKLSDKGRWRRFEEKRLMKEESGRQALKALIRLVEETFVKPNTRKRTEELQAQFEQRRNELEKEYKDALEELKKTDLMVESKEEEKERKLLEEQAVDREHAEAESTALSEMISADVILDSQRPNNTEDPNLLEDDFLSPTAEGFGNFEEFLHDIDRRISAQPGELQSLERELEPLDNSYLNDNDLMSSLHDKDFLPSPELVGVARSLSSDDSGFESDLLQNAEDVEDELESEDELGSDDSSLSEDDTSPRHIGRPVTFTISQKGKQLANFLGFEFHRHSSVKTSVYWRCSRRVDLNCPGRIVTDLGGSVVKISNNIHPEHLADSARGSARTAKASLKQMAVELTSMSTDQIVTVVRSEVHPASRGLLGSAPALARTARRARAKLNQAKLPNAKSLAELTIPDCFRCYVQKNDLTNAEIVKKFLLFDSGHKDADDRILIFGTDEDLSKLAASQEIFADGIFSAAPSLFQQLYTIHYRVGNTRTTLPAVYCLLPHKTTKTYLKMLKAIKDLKPSFSPSSLVVDFEAAAIKAFRTVFPGIKVSGCFFHLAQSQRRQINKDLKGLKSQLRKDRILNLQVRMIRAMAFVPVDKILEVWGDLTAVLDRRLDPMRNWFEVSYVGRQPLRGSNLPLFSHETWNVHARLMADQPKTNNSVEAFHSALVKLFGCAHPTMWKFIETLQMYQLKDDGNVAVFLDLVGLIMNSAGIEQDPNLSERFKNIFRLLSVALVRHATKPLDFTGMSSDQIRKLEEEYQAFAARLLSASGGRAPGGRARNEESGSPQDEMAKLKARVRRAQKRIMVNFVDCCLNLVDEIPGEIGSPRVDDFFNRLNDLSENMRGARRQATTAAQQKLAELQNEMITTKKPYHNPIRSLSLLQRAEERVDLVKSTTRWLKRKVVQIDQQIQEIDERIARKKRRLDEWSKKEPTDFIHVKKSYAQDSLNAECIWIICLQAMVLYMEARIDEFGIPLPTAAQIRFECKSLNEQCGTTKEDVKKLRLFLGYISRDPAMRRNYMEKFGERSTAIQLLLKSGGSFLSWIPHEIFNVQILKDLMGALKCE